MAGEESNVFLADMKRRIADRITPRILAGCPKACAHDARVPVVFVSSGLVDVYVSWLRKLDEPNECRRSLGYDA